MIPSNLYPTKDGRVFISAGVLSQVHRLYTAMGRADLINTPYGENQNTRVKLRSEIDKLITDWTSTMTTEEVCTLLKRSDVPCTRLPTFDEVCNDPQLISRNMIIEVEQALSAGQGAWLAVQAVQDSRYISYPAPILGESNHDVLADILGYSEEKIDELSSEGRPVPPLYLMKFL
jgi:formyl-CoA transferase